MRARAWNLVGLVCSVRRPIPRCHLPASTRFVTTLCAGNYCMLLLSRQLAGQRPLTPIASGNALRKPCDHTTCDACSAEQGCGWCPATSQCMQGGALGPCGGGCRDHWTVSTPQRNMSLAASPAGRCAETPGAAHVRRWDTAPIGPALITRAAMIASPRRCVAGVRGCRCAWPAQQSNHSSSVAHRATEGTLAQASLGSCRMSLLWRR